MHQSKMSGDGDKEAYKKNTWKALIGMRLNSNWSMEGQYEVNDVATKTNNAITFNFVFILLPLYYYIIFKKTGR
jgi:hypothetical protein